MSKTLVVSADFSENDIPVLLVGELNNGKTTIINEFKDSRAIEIYDLLTKASNPLMTHLSLSIVKLRRYTTATEWVDLYEFIEDYETANTLAQLAMSEKEANELIIIMPGWNRGIKEYPNEYEEALRLAEKYKYVNLEPKKGEK